MESLGDLEYHTILTKLGAEDTARVSCVNRKLRSSASDDSLWSRICSRELLLSRPLDPFSNSVPTFQKSYQTWRESFSAYSWETVKRANSCSVRLRTWLLENFPESAATLQPGASEAEIDEAERKLGLKFPLLTRILYRFFDGQEFDNYSDTLHGCPLGVIGGYSFYDRTVNVYLLPLADIVSRTAEIRRLSRRRVVIAASSSIISKTFLLDCNDNRLHVGTKNFPATGETIPCAPSMLSWLEEHIRRLETGIIKLRQGRRKRKSSPRRSISLFPEQPPWCSEAISSSGGVKVRASAVLVPEFSDLIDEREKYFFAYSVRMSMLPRGSGSVGSGSCQLYWRHWRIRAGERVVSEVNGEGVVGKFPVLIPGEEEFVYESCTPLQSSKGSIEGFFTFVSGRLSDQKDDPFRVEVAQFPLELPDYIF